MRDAELLARYGRSTVRSKCRHIIDNIQYDVFAVLCHIPGQKYTIGRHWNNANNEQDEFILCEKKGVALTGTHCEISCENDGSFWVKDLQKRKAKQNGTFINGVRISKTTKLKFGDILGLGNDFTELDNNRCEMFPVFLFKRREYPPPQNEKLKGKRRFSKCKPDLVFLPGQNSLVLSNILSYLSVQDLKQCRLVAKIWDEESTKKLRRMTQIKLNFPFSYFHPMDTMRLFYFMHIFGSPESLLSPRNLSIELPRFGGQSPPEALGLKFSSDLQLFLQLDHVGVKELKLQSFVRCNEDWDHCVRILSKFATIQSLHLIIRLFSDCRPSAFPDIQFPDLKRLTIELCFLSHNPQLNYHQEKENLNFFIDGIFRAAPNVESLLFPIESGDFEIVAKNMGPSAFPKLKEICLSTTPTRYISLLLDMKRNLSKIHLHRIQIADSEKLSTLLRKHANTLKDLMFSFENNPNHIHVAVNIPVLPKLERLEIGAARRVAIVAVSFGGDFQNINYAKHFPKLETLKLQPLLATRFKVDDVWEKFAPCLDPFFPSGTDVVCTTLRYLDIPYHGGTKQLCRGVETIAKMFPNVSNSELNRARVNETKVKTRYMSSRRRGDII